MATDTYRAKRVSLQVWIDPETRRALKQAALDQGQSVTDIVRESIEDWFTKHAQERMDELTADYREKTRAHQEFIRLTGGSTIG